MAILLWAIGISLTNVAHLGPFGLVTAVPIVFYLGVATVVASFIVEMRSNGPSSWRLALHAVVLIVMLYGTAALVYREGRYPWLYGTIGVVQYVSAHGDLNRHIDIYQNWPGFFAVAAWFDKVAGVASPVVYAKWAQLAFELAALPLLYISFSALGLTIRQRWFAIVLYFSSNWIGQDYLSPQGLGTLLSLGVLALTCRYLIVEPARRYPAPDGAADVPVEHGVSPSSSSAEIVAACVAIFFTYFVLTFTHELSPYIVALQLGLLAIARRIRPRWVPLVLAAIAIAYLAPRFTFINDRYGILASIGKFFGNATPPSATTPVTTDLLLVERAADALALIIWALAIVGAWMRRQAGRPVLALSLLAFSPVFVLFLVHYGNEASIRVFLFSLPWSAALASCALVPDAMQTVERDRRSAPRFASLNTMRQSLVKAMRNAAHALFIRRPELSFVRWSVSLVVALFLFFPAFYGNDRINVMTPSEVATVTSFYQSAKPGPIYLAIASAPVGASSRYNLFSTPYIFGPGGVVASNPLQPNFATAVEYAANDYTGGSEPAYVLVTPSMYAYDEGVRDTPVRNITKLVHQLARSSAWFPVVRHDGTYIYELPAAGTHPDRTDPRRTPPIKYFGVPYPLTHES